MQRETNDIGLNISLPGNPQSSAFPTPVLVQQQVLRNADGQQIGHPTMQQSPTVADDYTDERLAELNGVFAMVGLKLVREG